MTTTTIAADAAPAAPDDEFETAFAEFAADDGRDDGEGGQHDATPEEPPALPGDEGEGEDEAPAGDVKTDEAPADDVWAGAKPEARAAYEAAIAERQRLEHASKSDRGRVSRLTKELEAFRASQKAPAASAPAIPEDDEIKAFEEEYPEVAKPIRKMLSSVTQEAEAQRAERARAEAQREVAARETSLAEKHPDWLAQVQRPEFATWLETQPQYVIQAAVRNADRINDADEAADLIGRFKASLPASEATQQTAASAAPPNLAARRAKQLESATAVRSRGPGPADGVPDDFEQAFAHYAAKDARRRRA